MSYFKPNTDKKDLIDKYGQTFGLPLFNERLESIGKRNESISTKRNSGNTYIAKQKEIQIMREWIWDASGIKAEVYKNLKKGLSESRIKLIIGYLKLGGEATDNELEAVCGLKLSAICGRRNELMKLGIVEGFAGRKKPSPYENGNPNQIWELNLDKLKQFYHNIN